MQWPEEMGVELQRPVRAHCRQWGFDWGAAWSLVLLLLLVNPRVGPANRTTLNHNLRKSGGWAVLPFLSHTF